MLLVYGDVLLKCSHGIFLFAAYFVSTKGKALEWANCLCRRRKTHETESLYYTHRAGDSDDEAAEEQIPIVVNTTQPINGAL